MRRYFELRYEELVTTPELTLQPLCAFLDEPFETAMLDFHRVERNVDGTEEWSAEAVRRPVFRDSVGRYRSVLNARQLAEVLRVAGPTLASLGYLESRQTLPCRVI